MDKTYSNLMDIVSRTKKIDDKTGVKPRPRTIPKIQLKEDIVEEVVEEIIEEKPVRKATPKKSLVENSAIGNFLNKPKKATTKSKTTKKAETKKSEDDKESKKTTKKASTKPATKAKTTTKKSSADTLEKLKSIKTTKKVSTPTAKTTSNIDYKDPKNAQLYSALHNTLFSGGTDISEYINNDQPEDAPSAEMLRELKAKQEAKRINQEITKEQQEYEQLFTGSFSSFGDVQPEAEIEEVEESTSDDSARLREYFASIEKASAENSDQTNSAIPGMDIDQLDTDQKIAEYYRRKQEKIEKEAMEEEVDNTPKYSEYESRQNEYEAIFNGPVMSREELKETEDTNTAHSVEETQDIANQNVQEYKEESVEETPVIESVQELQENVEEQKIEENDDTLDNEDIAKLSLNDIYKTITDRFNITESEVKEETPVEAVIEETPEEPKIIEEVAEDTIDDRANRIVDELKDEEISEEVSELDALTDEELESYIVSSNVPEIEAQAQPEEPKVEYSEEDNEIVLNDLNTAFSIFTENLKQNELEKESYKDDFDKYEANKEVSDYFKVEEPKTDIEEVEEEIQNVEETEEDIEETINVAEPEEIEKSDDVDILARAQGDVEQNIESEDIEELKDTDDFNEVEKLDLDSLSEEDDEDFEENEEYEEEETVEGEIDTDEELEEEDEAEESDTISKEEFYNEMARLQENLLSELRGEKVTTPSVDLFEEPKVQIVEEPAPERMEKTAEEKDEEINDYAKKLVDKIIANIDNKNKEEEKQKQDPIVLKIQVEGQTNQTAPQPQPEVVETKEEVEKEEEIQEQLIDTLEESVKTTEEVLEELDRDSLLNSDIALNESDLEFEEKATAPKEVVEDDYFYLSPEDNEKKALPQDEYMQMYKEEASGTTEKEVGDINLNKDIQNAIPSSKLVMEKQENIETNEKEDGIETIYTLFGMERKKVKTNVEKDLKILYVASECQPFIATGGLADVAGSLPKAVAKNSGVDIRVMLPLYGEIKNEYREKFEYIGNFTVHLSWRQEYCGLFRYHDQGVTYYFIDNERYFKRNKAYGFYDDGERFAYFCKAVVESLPMINFFPDIIHCNDWQTALVSTYIKTGNWSDHRYYSIKNLYTIHNVEYQGVYGMENLKDLFGIDPRFRNDMDYNGDINLTKAAIQFSDKFTTVSNSYCDNLKQPYCSRGLHHIIIRNEYKLSGIVNGIDLDFYNPAMDTCLYKNFDIHSIDEKVMNKKIWQDELGLPVDGDTPMIAIVSRLVSHKGLDLVSKMMESVLSQDVQLVVVGTGDQRFIDYFKYLEDKYPTKVRALVDKYSNDLARKAYGASDIFLMPSKIEPCGISQMIASRYGSVPIVREVGGLKDTITDFGCAGGGNGYTFTNYNPNDLLYQVNRAINDYKDKDGWRKKMETCMSIDFSWDKSAVKYIDLYKSLMKY